MAKVAAARHSIADLAELSKFSNLLPGGASPSQTSPLRAAVATSASQLRTLKASRLLLQPPGTRLVTGLCWGRPMSYMASISRFCRQVAVTTAFTFRESLGAEPPESQGVWGRSPPEFRGSGRRSPPGFRGSAGRTPLGCEGCRGLQPPA